MRPCSPSSPRKRRKAREGTPLPFQGTTLKLPNPLLVSYWPHWSPAPQTQGKLGNVVHLPSSRVSLLWEEVSATVSAKAWHPEPATASLGLGSCTFVHAGHLCPPPLSCLQLREAFPDHHRPGLGLRVSMPTDHMVLWVRVDLPPHPRAGVTPDSFLCPLPSTKPATAWAAGNREWRSN